MIPRRPGQFVRKQFRWRFGLLFVTWVVAVVLGLLGFLRWSWPVLLVALSLLILVGHRKFEGGDLDPFPWLRGARGEEAVGAVLDDLKQAGYQAIHDIDTGHGNIDHVVVGPTGVFAIETKNLKGRFDSKNGRLTHNGWDEMAIVKQATRAAMEVKHRLAASGINVWVEAVVVSTKPGVLGKPLCVGNTTVIDSADLPAFIRRPRAKALSAQEVSRFVAAILRREQPVSVRSKHD